MDGQGEQVDDVEQLRAELERTREELHAARGQMATLVSKLGHDLNNTLGTVRGFADLLVEDAGDSPHVAASAGRIVRSADRTLEVVAAAVDEARATVTRHAPDVVDLGELTREVVAELAAEGRQVPVVVTDDAPTVLGMRSKLRQVVRVLVANTAQHAPGGKLTVRSEGSGERLTIVFQDDGPGIPAADLDRALEAGTALTGEGAGDGLATARRLIEEHAGKVWLTSRAGDGLTVHIVLPSRAADADA